jgi:hypothetical protein
MNIIKDGTELAEYRNKGWWVGMKVRCCDCELEATLEWKDRDAIRRGFHYTRHGRGGFGEATAKCPKCGSELRGTVDREEFHARIRAVENATALPPNSEFRRAGPEPSE